MLIVIGLNNLTYKNKFFIRGAFALFLFYFLSLKIFFCFNLFFINYRFSYNLTMAGEDLFGIIERMGVWAQRWVIQDIGPEDTDPDMLMWDMQRRINLDKLPPRRIVVQFELLGAQRKIYWLVLEKPQPSICLEDPGFEIDLVVTADSLALHRVWMGRLDIADALRKDQIKLEGPVDLKRAFPGWLALNLFAGVPYEGVATTA